MKLVPGITTRAMAAPIGGLLRSSTSTDARSGEPAIAYSKYASFR